jgi:arsenite methyltransferase
MRDDEIRKAVRKGYAQRAQRGGCGCSPSPSCCGEASAVAGDPVAQAVAEADLGLGCGSPVEAAALQPGETVLDLGCGAGFDVFLASAKVGPIGKAIGVDMTPEMLDRARATARKNGVENVEFRLGEIENLPVADDSVDAIISNCVINLSPDKLRTFREAFRVLRPGGRVLVSDVVLLRPLPEHVKNSVDAYVSCVAGAILKEDYLQAMRDAGFEDVRIVQETRAIAEEQLGISVASAKVSARKP